MTHVLGRCLLVCALVSFAVTLPAAEKKTTKSKSTASKTTTAKKDQISGRLPRYFSSLVDDKQRAEIYEIQASYREQIEALEKQLAELKEEEMEEIEGVLTSTQLKALTDLRSGKKAATSKTAASKSSSSKSSSKSTASKSSSSRSAKAKPASSRSSRAKKSSAEN